MRYFIETRNWHPTAELVEDEEGDLWRQVDEEDLACPHCEFVGATQWERVTDEARRCDECLEE